MTVYTILKQANHDYSAAEKYGNLSVLFPLGVNVVDVNVILDAAGDWFSDFDFEDDIFMPIGNPIIVSIVTICLVEEMALRGKDTVNMLEWDKYSREYVVKEVEINHYEGQTDE